MSLNPKKLLRRLSELDKLARAGATLDGFPWEVVSPFAHLWSESWPGEVAEALSEVDDIALALEEDCPPGGPQWLALALRDGSTVSRESDDSETRDVLLWPGSATVADNLDAAPLLIVGGDLSVAGWLRVNDGSTVVVAGGLKAQGIRCIGNLVVLGDVEADFVRAEGNGGLIFARQLSCRVYDNPQLALHSRLVAESALHAAWPSDTPRGSPESLLVEGLIRRDPTSGTASLDYAELERRRRAKQPLFRGT